MYSVVNENKSNRTEHKKVFQNIIYTLTNHYNTNKLCNVRNSHHGWIIDRHQLAVDRYLIFSQMPNFFFLIIKPVTFHLIFL